MKSEILTLLRENGGFVSGQELCTRFGVSRSAVWKAIGTLKKEGYTIESVPNKGYRLIEEADNLSQHALESRLQGRWAGKTVFFHEVIGSTNTEAKRLAEEGAAHGTLVVADMQTAGKGRRGRSWDSPAGYNVYFTLLLRPDFAPDKASMLTLVMALAVQKGIEDLCGAGTLIKWPNDIVLNGRKITGILTEMTVEESEIGNVVIGVGINIRKREFPEEIAATASTLEAETGISINRADLLKCIMIRFEEFYEEFLKTTDLSGLKAIYEEALVNKGKEVCVLDPAGEYRGVAEGIDDHGELLVRTDDGSIRTIYAGEVSVRGVYGYV